MDHRDFPAPFSEAEAIAFWNRLSKEQRLALLRKANQSLGASEDTLAPYADHDWDTMPENGLTDQLKKHVPGIGRAFEAELKAGQ